MRVSPAALPSMTPPWTVTHLGSPRGSVRTMASSASTNTAMRPRKCAAMTAPPAATGLVRSTTDVVSLRVSLISSDAALEPFGDGLARQVAANEDDAAVSLLVFGPWPLVIAVKDHVHALEDKALIVVLEGQDALAAQNVRALLLHQILHPRKELVRIERLVRAQRNRLHVLVVVVLEPAVRMRVFVAVLLVMVVMMAVIMIVVVIVAVIVVFEEFRLDVEDAIEIEGVAA